MFDRCSLISCSQVCDTIQFSLSLLLLLCVPFGERAGTRRKPERQIERRTAAAGSHGQVVFGACVRLAAAAAEKGA